MPTTNGPSARLRFGEFEFDQAAGELYRGGRPVRLQEQPRQVLAALLARPGEVVSRDELRDRLWKSDTFVDFEHGLNTAIKKVRHALGDSADAPQFVETLARRGYRFVAPIASAQTLSLAATPLHTPAVVRQVRWITWPAGRALLAVSLVAAVAAAGWLARLPGGTAATSRQAAANLAVIPLKVIGPEGDDAGYLGVGIADAIITRLANVRQIALRPTSAVLAYRDGASNPGRVAAELGVEHLLVGTIQRAQNTYRVAVQLVGADGVVMWGRTYDLSHGGLLGLQDQVAEHVVEALRLELTAPERARLTARHTTNAAAHDLYLRGRALLVNYTDANMREAIAYFERALTLDPQYALARSALATAYAWFSVRYSHESEAASWSQLAIEQARRALQENEGLAEAHLAIGNAAGTLHGGFDWATLMRESAKALALDPSLEAAHVARMRALYHLGLFDETRREAARARALKPNPDVEASRIELAILLYTGDFASVVDTGTALLRRTDAPAVRQYVGLARYYLGDVGGALEMLASVKRNGKPDVRSQASLASVEAAAGLRKEARARAAAVEVGTYMDHHVAYSLGAAWAQLGDARAAVRWVQEAADSGFPCYPWFQRDRLLDPVRSDPAFLQLMDRIESRHRAAMSVSASSR